MRLRPLIRLTWALSIPLLRPLLWLPPPLLMTQPPRLRLPRVLLPALSLRSVLPRPTVPQSTLESSYGPVVTASPSVWVSDAALTAPATAATVAPSGYVAANGFNNLQGSLQEMGYLTVKTLQSYNPQKCADYCDAEDLCMGFDIYFERDPATDTGCAPNKNPDSITTIGCTLYAYHVAASLATNKGQWRDNFQVVITGSNGYNKISSKISNTVKAIDGFKAPQDFGTKAVNAKPYHGFDSYITYKTYTDAYDPRLCAKACKTQTAYNIKYPNRDGTYKACNYFVAYVLAKNDEPQVPGPSTTATTTGATTTLSTTRLRTLLTALSTSATTQLFRTLYTLTLKCRAQVGGSWYWEMYECEGRNEATNWLRQLFCTR
ncbi:hypothetical protein MPH_02558 [Macrophomina phaseolina MS6]|uniref:Uncharacterized protein n=1 Tax=Macrophomina phaseolina (strain MS6) TaxID=1126212 RepID=K2RZF1_MACPH|nr:hypothetical protein MPH_02558 [Macrophomina phaseolina MS6]